MQDLEGAFLQRQWELLEGNKRLRSQIPTVCCSLIVGLAAFYFQPDKSERLTGQAPVFAIFIGLVGLFGLSALVVVHLQYLYSNSKIERLYKAFNMKFLEIQGFERNPLYESGMLLFVLGYASIVFFTIVALFGILWRG